MGIAQAITFAVAGAANGVGVVVAAGVWRRARRDASAARSRHPSARPPVAVSLIDGPQRRWAVAIRPEAPATSIDIISYRAARGGWASEPFVDPIELQPGGWVQLPPEVQGAPGSFEVVIGWTSRTPAGAQTGSQLFRIPEPATPPATTGRMWGLVAVALVAACLAVLALVAWAAVDEYADASTGVASTVIGQLSST